MFLVGGAAAGGLWCPMARHDATPWRASTRGGARAHGELDDARVRHGEPTACGADRAGAVGVRTTSALGTGLFDVGV